ncbi:MAG: hypothetical protein VKK59_00275 [Vampirovibrionales bacterium]|nr:hypothetical protein [Vampirovibrionales bacterium]
MNAFIAHTAQATAQNVASKANWLLTGKNTLNLAAKVLDQPAIVSRAYHLAPWGYGGIAAVATAKDLQAARNEGETTQALIRNGLVMGATSLVTILAARKWMGNPHSVEEVMHSKTLLKKSMGALKRNGVSLLDRLKNATQVLSKSATAHHNHGHEHGLEEAISFLKVGTASVATATTTALLANALDGEKTAWQKGEQSEHILQESVFQYLANIALCGFALGGAAKAANALGWHKANAPWKRSAMLATGLALSVALGGSVANWIGRRLIDPIMDTIKTGDFSRANVSYQLSKAARNTTNNRRHVEPQDLILHLDDAPLLFNALGSKLFEPLIQLFFMPSAYRIGKGYRSSPPSDAAGSMNEKALLSLKNTKTNHPQRMATHPLGISSSPINALPPVAAALPLLASPTRVPPLPNTFYSFSRTIPAIGLSSTVSPSLNIPNQGLLYPPNIV